MIQKDMTIKDIQDLIFGDEDRVLELKKSTGELKDGMKSACAFLNTDGGWVIFAEEFGMFPQKTKSIPSSMLMPASRSFTMIPIG